NGQVGIGNPNPRGTLEVKEADPSKVATLVMADSDVSQPFSTYLDKDAFLMITANSGIGGGALMTSVIGEDSDAFTLPASVGALNPISAAISLVGSKYDGKRGRAPMTGQEVTVRLGNDGNPSVDVHGDNSVKFYGAINIASGGIRHDAGNIG